jgi:hypothetical protein
MPRPERFLQASGGPLHGMRLETPMEDHRHGDVIVFRHLNMLGKVKQVRYMYNDGGGHPYLDYHALQFSRLKITLTKFGEKKDVPTETSG